MSIPEAYLARAIASSLVSKRTPKSKEAISSHENRNGEIELRKEIQKWAELLYDYENISDDIFVSDHPMR